MKRSWPAYISAVAGVMLMIGAVAYFSTNRPIAVEIASIENNVPVRVFGLGTVEARVLSKIGFEVGAALTELAVDSGDPVAKGQVLARLHTAEQEARVARAEAAVAAAQQSLLASHPNIPTSDGVLPITLHDALNDMTPLQTPERFGPVGEHPGVMLADSGSFVTRSDALTEDFSMIVTAATNHQRVDGIDLSALGGGDLFIQAGGETPLEFDFDNLELEGIAPVPVTPEPGKS